MSRKVKEHRQNRQAQAAADPKSHRMQEAWGELVDYRRDYYSDSPGFGPSLVIGGDSNARREGANRPFIETDTDLQFMRANARAVTTVSPSAKCAQNNLQSYILGKGFAYSAVAKSEQAEQLVETVKEIIEEFLECNKWQLQYETEAVRRTFRDGECFMAVYRRRDGVAAVRFVEPEYVTEPGNARAIESQFGIDDPVNWNFGICTADDDVSTVYGYHVQWPGSMANYDYYSSERMVHCKINADSTVKRGMSDFYAVYQYLNDAAKLLRNTVRGASVLAAIAMIVESAAGTSAAAAESLRGSSSFAAYREPSPAGDSKNRFVQEYKPGSILRTPNGTQYKASPLSNNTMGESCVEIEQAVLRIAGSNWCMPEYMISGDASNANYASTLVSESPFVKYCERQQTFFAWTFEEVIWRVLKIAIEAGRIPVGSVRELRRYVKLQTEAPRVATQNAKEETDRNQILSNAGLLSEKTWAANEGLDYDQEKSNGAKKAEIVPPIVPPAVPQPTPVAESVDRVKLAKELLWDGYPAKK